MVIKIHDSLLVDESSSLSSNMVNFYQINLDIINYESSIAKYALQNEFAIVLDESTFVIESGVKDVFDRIVKFINEFVDKFGKSIRLAVAKLALKYSTLLDRIKRYKDMIDSDDWEDDSSITVKGHVITEFSQFNKSFDEILKLTTFIEDIGNIIDKKNYINSKNTKYANFVKGKYEERLYNTIGIARGDSIKSHIEYMLIEEKEFAHTKGDVNLLITRIEEGSSFSRAILQNANHMITELKKLSVKIADNKTEMKERIYKNMDDDNKRDIGGIYSLVNQQSSVMSSMVSTIASIINQYNSDTIMTYAEGVKNAMSVLIKLCGQGGKH